MFNRRDFSKTNFAPLIEKAKSIVLENIGNELVGAWIAHKGPEISAEAQKEIDRLQAIYDANYKKSYQDYEKEYSAFIKEHKKYYRKYGYYPSYGKPYPPAKINAEEQRGTITARIVFQYKRDFPLVEWNQRLKNKFTSTIDEFNSQFVLVRFLNRHPWLYTQGLENGEYGNEDHLVWQFLIKLYQEKLKTLIIPSIRESDSWQEFDGKYLEPGYVLCWNKLDQKEVDDRIAGYPLSKVKAFFIDRKCNEYPHYIQAPSLSVNSPPQRIDLIRLLSHYNQAAMESAVRGKVDCTAMAPLHISELNLLKAPQIKELNIILVNVGLEEKPQWVLLQRDKQPWIAYFPPVDVIPEQQRKEIMQHINRDIFQCDLVEVNYRENMQLNDIDFIDPITAWHCVLLSRVLPCVMKGKKLETFRCQVPLPLLLQEMFEACLQCDQEKLKLTTSAYVQRDPFTNQTVDGLLSKAMKGTVSLFTPPGLPVTSLEARTILNEFDEDVHQIPEGKEFDTFVLSKEASVLQLTEALTMIYHHKLSRFQYPPIPLSGPLDINYSLFSYDMHLKTIIPDAKAVGNSKELLVYQYPFQCAARNRFLSAMNEYDESIDSRKSLWTTAGRLISEYFQVGPAIDLELIEAAVQFKQAWYKQSCSQEMKGQGINGDGWAFVQIAEMGAKGLIALCDYLINKYSNAWDPVLKVPAPALKAVFDLNSGMTDNPVDYMEALEVIIKKFQCVPLFASLSFIMPKTLDRDSLASFVKIIEALDLRGDRYPEEVEEVALYDLSLTETPKTVALIECLERLANHDLSILIKIPAWDRASPVDKQECALKARYRALQNKILDNQRLKHRVKLKTNIAVIHELDSKQLPPEVDLKENISLRPQPWDGPNTVYPLAMQMPSIQQQLQEQVEHEYQPVREQKTAPEIEVEVEQKISPYTKDESTLITRLNIGDKCQALWDQIPASVKEHSGLTGKELSELFSLWVGSDKNAAQVIETIEPEAVKELMQHANHYRFGITKDNRPPGFSLGLSKDQNRLILCFSELQKIKDIHERQAKPLKKRNHFTVVTHTPRKAVEFKGDFRQFSSLSNDPGLQQTLWRYLATEDHDVKRIDNAINAYRQQSVADQKRIDDQAVSVIMQRFDALGDINSPDGYEAVLSCLKRWGQSKRFLSQLVSAFLDSTQKQTVLSEKNLKSLGQLFNHYDAQDQKENGTERWFQLAGKILAAFGSEAFKIWKKRFVDASDNFSEHLEQDEVEAISQSIVTLKEQEHQDIWWMLVEAHGRATGNMRYAPLWHAYAHFLEFLEEQHLHINQEALKRYLSQENNFNAIVLLDKLKFALKRAACQVDYRNIQKGILDNLDKIDWRHCGYYYACRYENYPYWHQSLKLESLHTTYESKEGSYTTEWECNRRIEDPVTHALRFGVKRLNLTYTEYLQFEKLIKGLPRDPSGQFTRLYVATIAYGVDRFEQLSTDGIEHIYREQDPDFIKFIQWLNKQLSLRGTLQSNTYHLSFSDIKNFYDVIKHVGLSDQIDSLGLEWINACGRALRCFKGEGKEDKLKLLVGFAKGKNYLEHPCLMVYPWLSKDIYREDPLTTALRKVFHSAIKNQLDILEKQLKSILISYSRYLPDHAALTKAFDDIATSKDAAAAADMRKQVVANWIQQGCAITYQDAQFRSINDVEQKIAMGYLDSNCLPVHYSQNKGLFKKLLTSHLTVDNDAGGEQQVRTLLALFVRLDNKSHYNELGQLLGLLLSKASADNRNRYYSIPQLTTWLESLLVEAAKYEKLHYPVDLLDEILTAHLGNVRSSLLNSDLQCLGARTDLKQQHQIQSISRATFPNQYKPILVRLVMHHRDQMSHITYAQTLLQKLSDEKIDPQWIEAISQLMIVLVKPNSPYFSSNIKILEFHSCQLKEVQNFKYTDILEKLWKNTQIKSIKMMAEGKLDHIHDLFSWGKLTTAYDIYVQIIIVHAMNAERPDGNLLIALRAKLSKWPEEELALLAQYFSQKLTLSDEVLNKILANNECNTAEKVIHQFEAVEQGLEAKGEPKRHYSIQPEDKTQLLRVLNNIKRKGKDRAIDPKEQKLLLNLLYYINSYSQASTLQTLTFDQLKSQLDQARKAILNSRLPVKYYAQARMLACMREILLRKTGKWATHTQMTALLYAAIYNDTRLLHQVNTGQGKSIITAMRTGYLALTGKIVDLFSAKESLSFRDHEKFSAVMDGFGVQHSYITSSSDASTYKDTLDANGIGAVNFATPGNWSLFQSAQAWKGKASIQFNQKGRVAFLDECDDILSYQKTMYNYSDSTEFTDSGRAESDAFYNLDEWIYRLAYDYYLEMREAGQHPEKIARNPHLKELCERLQQHVEFSPKESKFFEKFIIPALSKTPEAILNRDQALRQLLMASHTAYTLKEGIDYSIRPDKRTVSGGMVIKIHFGKVTIDNQIREGSTFSDLVHQFLHVRLNKEAVARGETPNFFIEPETQIVLSQNVNYMLNTYYDQLEGGSGTAGSSDDLWYYSQEYGIDHIIKYPTHEELKTILHPTLYLDSLDDQVNVLVKQIIEDSKKQPILVHCEDDIQVKKLSQLVREKIEKTPGLQFDFKKFIVDTNDSGISENTIIPRAGETGAVVFSARLKRGSDIVPQSDLGLNVKRVYFTIPSNEKQERGRTGRNGASGSSQNIYNYDAIQTLYKQYQENYSAELKAIYQAEKEHLDKKLKKHQDKKSAKWQHLENDKDIYQKYLITRVTARLKHELKQKQEQYLRRKEYLISVLSGNMMSALRYYIGKPEHNLRVRELKKAWVNCRKAIEIAWNERLAGKTEDNEEIYQAFLNHAENIWKRFALMDAGLSAHIFNNLNKKLKRPQSTASQANIAAVAVTQGSDETKDMPEIAELYQQWIKGAESVYFGQAGSAKPEMIDKLYGQSREGLEKLYLALNQASIQDRKLLFEKFKEYLAKPFEEFKGSQAKPPGAIYGLTCECIAKAVEFMADEKNWSHHQQYFRCLEVFFKQSFFNKPIAEYTVDDIDKNSRLFDLVRDIFTNQYVEKDDATLKLIDNICIIIQHYYWGNFDKRFSDDLIAIIASDPQITTLITSVSNLPDLHYIIDLIYKNRNSTNRNKKRNQLIQYLQNKAVSESKRSTADTNAQALLEKPALVRPLVELTLANNTLCTAESKEGNLKFQLNHLPLIHELAQWGPKIHAEFWNFLSRRTPVNELSYKKLMNLMPETVTDEGYAQFLEPLFSMPPFVSVDYIVKNIAMLPGRHFLKQTHNKILELQKAGLALNRFLAIKGLVDAHYLKPQATQQTILHYLSHFNQLAIEQNQSYFELATQYPQLSDRTLNGIAKALNLETIKIEDLADVFHHANHYKQISSEALNQFIQRKFDQLLEEKMESRLALQEKLKQLEDFYTIVKHDDNLFDQNDLDYLFKAWQASAFDQALLTDAVKLLSKIKRFDRDNHQQYVSLRQVYFSKPISLEHNKQCRAYLTEANQVIALANGLEQGEIRYNDYFYYFRQHQSERQLLLKHLHHRLLKSNALYTRCFDEYSVLTNKVTKLNDSKSLSPEQQRKAWRESYLGVVQLSEEIVKISSHPYLRENKEEVKQNNGQFNCGRYQGFFEEKEKLYRSFWWTNSERREQATILFSRLKLLTNVNHNDHKDFYIASLRTIWETQQAIMRSDRDTTRNQKGYSRLFDITVQMFVTIAADFIKDTSVTLNDKMAFSVMIKHQLNYTIEILWSRLPNNHPVKGKLIPLSRRAILHNGWSFGSTELNDLIELLKDVNAQRKSVPKELHYLLNNLECFVDLTQTAGNERHVPAL